MIMSVEELRQFLTTDESEPMLEFKLRAIETAIQGYTNNNFSRYMVNGEIVYPDDIKMGVVRLIEWDEKMRSKVGVQSESISRHSVTYQDQTSNTINGYPAHLMGFLRPYMKARFGQGVFV